MANGFVCVQCGWQETNHQHGWWMCEEGQQQDAERILPGFTCSLKDCQDYVPSKGEMTSDAAVELRGAEGAQKFNPGWMA